MTKDGSLVAFNCTKLAAFWIVAFTKNVFRDICNDIDFLSTPEKGLKNLIPKHQIMTERKENKLLS